MFCPAQVEWFVWSSKWRSDKRGVDGLHWRSRHQVWPTGQGSRQPDTGDDEGACARFTDGLLHWRQYLHVFDNSSSSSSPQYTTIITIIKTILDDDKNKVMTISQLQFTTIRLRYDDTTTDSTTTKVIEITITAIQLRYDYNEKLASSFFACVEWKQARAIRRSRIVVVS